MGAFSGNGAAGLMLALLVGAGPAAAQTPGPLDVADPAWPAGGGPRVYFDAGHDNGHGIDQEYAGLATLLGNDGFVVESGVLGFDTPAFVAALGRPHCLEELRGRYGVEDDVEPNPIEVLAVPTARDTLPISDAEAAVLRAWLRCGGALFHVVEYDPFRSPSVALARALGIRLGGTVNDSLDRMVFVPEASHPIAHGDGFDPVDDVANAGLALGLLPEPGHALSHPLHRLRSLLTYPADLSIEDPSHPAWLGTAGLPIESAITLDYGDGRAHVSGEASMYTCDVGCRLVENQNARYALNTFRWLSRAICDVGVPCTLEPDASFQLRDGDADGVPDDEDACVEARDPKQRDSNADGFGNRCDGDFDGDGVTATTDFLLFVGAWGALASDEAYDPALDLDSDGAIGAADWMIFAPLFGRPPGPSALAP